MNIETMNKHAQEYIGKSIYACTEADLKEIGTRMHGHAARMKAEADQGLAALTDASKCGCQIQAPTLDDGSPDVGHASVDHTCGKANS